MKRLVLMTVLALTPIMFGGASAQAPVETVTLRAKEYRVENHKVIVTLASAEEIVLNPSDVLQPAVTFRPLPAATNLTMRDLAVLPTLELATASLMANCQRQFPTTKQNEQRETCQNLQRRAYYDLFGRTAQINTVQRVAVRNRCSTEAAADFVRQNNCELAELPPATPSSRTFNGAAAPSRAATASRCQATTKAGTQCKRNAQPGRSYCWQH